MAILVLSLVGGACLFVMSQTVLGAGGITAGNSEVKAREVWHIGDSLRLQGKFADAVRAYERSLEILAVGKGDTTTRGSASKNMIEFCGAMPIDVKKLKDGTYQGKAQGYQAEISVEVTLKDGKITLFKIVDQKESAPRAALQEVPKRIMARQNPNVDASTRATCTSYGLMTATLHALQQAKDPEADKDKGKDKPK
jgi:uncharacterized protein with FMN-binding domain